jgi:VIT1/CCC1 family predicted Fe2+/Mn2+ transporter
MLITGVLFGKIQVRLQALATEDKIYETINLSIDLDMKRAEEGKILASRWNFSRGSRKEDQEWIQATLENIERLGWKMLYQGGER